MLTSRVLFAAALAALAVPPPVTVEADSSGRWHVSAAVGKAGYEAKSFDCSGEVTGTTPVDMRSWGVRVDYDLNDRDRITVFGGEISMPGQVIADASYDVYLEGLRDYNGIFGGAQFALEREQVGFGGGLVHVAGEDGFIGISTFLRLGYRDGLHVRGELMPAEPTFGSIGWLRLGLGDEPATRRQLGWYAGACIGPYTYADAFEPRFFADLRVPTIDDVDLLLTGQIGAGVDQLQWSVAGGLRWTP